MCPSIRPPLIGAADEQAAIHGVGVPIVLSGRLRGSTRLARFRWSCVNGGVSFTFWRLPGLMAIMLSLSSDCSDLFIGLDAIVTHNITVLAVLRYN